ncbi:FAD-binding oxidoreductase [Acidovorax sp. PRC11]|nr:FAD-binding oxidoreductase [Acidovorax sp. PRC11]MDT0136563.1 FAD-binding oxidoreductase [Acidovorax sp. PRC11]
MVAVHSWGRLQAAEHTLHALADHPPTRLPLAEGQHGLAHGMGRSYGDVCLNPGGALWATRGLDRFIAWNESTGELTCEAGVLLRDIQRTFVPRGWMLPVTPGTQFATVGGAIANDVHGKNHHVHGSFGDHVAALQLLRTDGLRMHCGPGLRPDWFAATVGGLGLTGVVTQATLRLRRVAGPWLDTETLPYASLREFFELSDASEADWEYTVSWIDCLSGADARGIFMRGNHVPGPVASPPRTPGGGKRTVPFAPPFSLVNRLSLRPFNTAYYHLHAQRAGRRLQHYEPFFYPLDNLLEWNRIYGRRGFHQYQCAVPREGGEGAVAALLGEISASGQGSFLGVLKTFGQRTPPGLLSFPMPGVTLALDFPNLGESTLRLFERLDTVVAAAGGRLYPAKDARMPRALFESGYPRLPEFLPYRDPRIRSAMSLRLFGD